MRINPFFVPIALIAALLGSAVIASAAGVWSTSARTTIDTASMTPADLKGWMTLQQVMDGLHISQSELYELGKIPADIPPSTALKDMEGVAPDFEVTGLRDALMALEKDHAFLLKNDVFTQDVIETWIDYKLKNEVLAMDLRPHPWEFALYYDI